MIDSSGGQPRKIVEGYAPAWSADGKTLYFVSGKDQKVKSVEVQADGSPGAVKDLFKASIQYLAAAISPGGRRVAYVSDGRLVVADREGDKTMPTWPTRLVSNWLLGWSPDAKILGGITVWGCSRARVPRSDHRAGSTDPVGAKCYAGLVSRRIDDCLRRQRGGRVRDLDDRG